MLRIKRAAIASAILVVVLIMIVAVVAGAFYFVSGSSPGASTAVTSRTSTTSSSSAVASHSTATSSTGTSGAKTYHGNFTYANPLGPFGINDSSGKPVEWNSTQSASGTFTFSIDPTTYTGTGSGQGSITVTTQGYCTGSETVKYTFKVEVAQPPGSSMILTFDTPTPGSVMVSLSCQGSTTGFNTANNPITFLSVYPNGLSVGAIPATFSQVPTAGISYTVTIQQG